MVFTHAVILDFEATCLARGRLDPQEIIEFPSVLLDLERGVTLDEFRAFVRPVHHPQLSDFCRELTSIRQEDVDPADPFPEVLARHAAWLQNHGLEEDRVLMVTCGDWDLGQMLPRQLEAASMTVADLPVVYRQWLNVKKLYCRVFDQPRVGGMKSMLRGLGLKLEGRHHRGIDDCRNIARILLALQDRGGEPEVTGRLESG